MSPFDRPRPSSSRTSCSRGVRRPSPRRPVAPQDAVPAHAQPAEQAHRRVGVPSGPQRLEPFQRCAGLGDGHGGPFGGQHLREVEPGARLLDGQAESPERRERGLQVADGARVLGRGRDEPGGVLGERGDEAGRAGVGQVLQLLRRRRGGVMVGAREVRAGEQEQHRCGEPRFAALAEESLGAGHGEFGLAPCDVQLDPRSDGVAVVLGADEELRGLREPSLPHAQPGQADDGGGAQRPVAAVVELEGGAQLALGVVPPAGRGQHSAVVGAADRADRDAVGAFDEAVGEREPVLRLDGRRRSARRRAASCSTSRRPRRGRAPRPRRPPPAPRRAAPSRRRPRPPPRGAGRVGSWRRRRCRWRRSRCAISTAAGQVVLAGRRVGRRRWPG